MASRTAQATLPWSWYSDPEVLRREQERVFRRAWQYVCPADLVAEPGAYCAGRVGDVPVVVVRDRDSTLRAFLNVCRHRGSVVAEGNGRRETLQCRYHAWTYALDGTVRAAPRAELEDGFDTDGIALLPLAVATWGPLVFVNPDPGAAPLADSLAPVAGPLSRELDVESLRFLRRAPFELACNWKVAVENYLECYHCPVAHPGFSAVVDVSPQAYRLETHGRSSSQFGPLRPGRAGGDVRTGQFHWLWPVTKLYVMPGPPNLAAGALAPVGPERTTGFLDYFFAEDVAEAEVEELLAFDDQVGREDRVLVESVQEGVRAGLLDEGRLLPESERLLAHFQRLVREALA
ncbi:MAG TPA: aromatic ring-hydroxylating dioxygenase subunit alpha [Gaiellaceae bacterium]|nr:aromatic ring-hydroxylating dioxygenase subunit alpha [Gaiellaceae bacterium]